jgi:hypothetical protein
VAFRLIEVSTQHREISKDDVPDGILGRKSARGLGRIRVTPRLAVNSDQGKAVGVRRRG